MLHRLSRIVLLGSAMALAACGAARLVQRTQTGGTLELQGDRGKAMEDANQQMAAHCGPNNFTILQEGEEPVGTTTYTREDQATDTATSRSGRRAASDTTTTSTQTTRTATAWRVHYQCGGGPIGEQPPPAAPPPGAPPPPPPAAPPSGW
jgi:hypothetical protein